MFRKNFHIAITILMLVTTMGFSISKHYCSDNLVSVTINDEAEACCDMGNGCCQNETSFYHLDDDFVFSVFTDNNIINQIDLLYPLLFVIVDSFSNKETDTIYSIPEPPPPLKIQATLSNLQTYLC